MINANFVKIFNPSQPNFDGERDLFLDAEFIFIFCKELKIYKCYPPKDFSKHFIKEDN